MTLPIPIKGLILDDLIAAGLYRRPTRIVDARLFDELSAREDYDGALSTEHANARFCLPFLANSDLALFVDGDILVRSNIGTLFEIAEIDPSKAVWCVKHDYRPTETMKMDGHKQTIYSRKNWSSCMLWNLAHKANERLTLEMVNTLPGRDLHALCWLNDDEIGALPPSWNWLCDDTPERDVDLCHFTRGTPSMPGFENVPFANEWRDALSAWAR